MSCARCGEYSEGRLCNECIEVLEKSIQCVENHCGTKCITSGLDIPSIEPIDCELGTQWTWEEVGRSCNIPVFPGINTCCYSGKYPLECLNNYLSGKQTCMSAIIFTEAFYQGKFYLKTIGGPLIKNAYNFGAFFII